MEGVNDDEVVDFATFGRERGVEVRFIEFMPLDADHGVGAAAGRARRARSSPPSTPCTRSSRWSGASEPAECWGYPDGRGRVGVIPTVTEPFCAPCDRVRLTAEGQLRSLPVRRSTRPTSGSLLRGGATDDDLAGRPSSSCVAKKWAGHQIGQVTFVRPRRSMSQIGG